MTLLLTRKLVKRKLMNGLKSKDKQCLIVNLKLSTLPGMFCCFIQKQSFPNLLSHVPLHGEMLTKPDYYLNSLVVKEIKTHFLSQVSLRLSVLRKEGTSKLGRTPQHFKRVMMLKCPSN